MSPGLFWHTKHFCHIFTPVDQLLCSILHKNGPTTYNEHFTAYNIMALVCAGWLHEVQWVLCTVFWSMDMTGVYAGLFEAVCDVTTVPSHLNMGRRGNSRFKIVANVRILRLGASCVACSGRVMKPTGPTSLCNSKFKTRWVVDRGKGNVGVQTGKGCLLTCHGRYLGWQCEKSLIVGDPTCDLHCVKRAWLMRGAAYHRHGHRHRVKEMVDTHSTHVCI